METTIGIVAPDLSDLAERIEAEHAAALGAARSAVEHAVACGRQLSEAKARVPHGA
jgi:hypothetical protein